MDDSGFMDYSGFMDFNGFSWIFPSYPLVMTFTLRHGIAPWPIYRNRCFTELHSMVDLSMAFF